MNSKKLKPFIFSIAFLFCSSFLVSTDVMSKSADSSSNQEQSLTKEELQKLRETNSFNSIKKFSGLPQSLQKQFGKMADVGGNFNAGCCRTPELPDLGLCFAAASKERVWISYQSGGICLVNRLELYSLTGEKNFLLWSTVTPKPVKSMDDLISLVQKELSKKNI